MSTCQEHDPVASDVPVRVDLFVRLDKVLEKVGGLCRARVQRFVGLCGMRRWRGGSGNDDGSLAIGGGVTNNGFKSDSHQNR